MPASPGCAAGAGQFCFRRHASNPASPVCTAPFCGSFVSVAKVSSVLQSGASNVQLWR